MRILAVPPMVPLPGVAMVSLVGICSLRSSYFDLRMMVSFWIAGWVFRKIGVPTVPIILGILLGGQMEDALRRSMVISDGDWTYLFSSPIAIGFWVAAVLGFVAPIVLRGLLRAPMGPEDLDSPR